MTTPCRPFLAYCRGYRTVALRLLDMPLMTSAAGWEAMQEGMFDAMDDTAPRAVPRLEPEVAAYLDRQRSAP